MSEPTVVQCTHCRALGMVRVIAWSGDDVDWDVCPVCDGEKVRRVAR